MDLTAAQFNERYPIGTPVIAYPGVRPEHPFYNAIAGGYCLETRTRSVAWTLGHGEPVVLVEGYAGGISLEHIDPQERPASSQLAECGATEENPRCTVSKHAICDQHH
jgi:hypothetical protein